MSKKYSKKHTLSDLYVSEIYFVRFAIITGSYIFTSEKK